MIELEDTRSLVECQFTEIHLDDIIAKLKTGTSCYENTRDAKELLDLKYLES